MPEKKKHRNACTPIEREGQKPFWQKIGVAFDKPDGTTTVVLNALPIGNRIVLFAQDERDEPQE